MSSGSEDDQTNEEKERKVQVNKTLIDPSSDSYLRENAVVEYSASSKFLIGLFAITLFLRFTFHLTDLILRLMHEEKAQYEAQIRKSIHYGFFFK